MTIQVKYWSIGASAPGSWTDLGVAQLYVRPVREPFDEGRALDGTNFNDRWKFYRATITVGKLSMNNSTFRTVVDALLDSDFVRISTALYSYLGNTNTINFVFSGGTDYSRARATLLAEDAVIELISEAVQ